MAQRSQAQVALGRAVRSFRHEKEFSQEDLAAQTGLHRTYIGGIERGERNPSYESLMRLADGLGVSAGQIVQRAEREG